MAILAQGLVLMLAGMGIVFCFLALLVWVMNRAANIVPRFNHILPDPEPKKKTGTANAAVNDDVMVAIAIAAVNAHAG
ncbi:MAG: OadG family protein [Kiritimatiellae bacterium]|nr:OadG family protein [Kiritimatiellia bacterium]MDD3544862.1 OadG family protein [Kiritimatiellia bacterium]MDD4025427.1 OadG family protein [Kiritimatiellia bacterium]MDD4623396.1 OadG family protein [Kiritimatiellia bacterium]